MSKLIIDGREISIDDQLRDLDRSDCEDDLYTFLKNAWKYIDSSDFTDGWPIQAVADHLQSVADGDIKRLIINIPPRCAKSSLTSVAFPAWVWAQPWSGHTSGPGIQFLHASYAQQLSLRDSVKCRRLIESPWYQSMWGDRFSLTSDQNTKTRFDNNKGGSRLSTSVGSALTGEGGNIIVVDDPNAAQEAFSEASIYNTIEWWDSALSTRLNDPKHGSFVVIQQRLSEEDLTGHILSKDMGEWTHLCYDFKTEILTNSGWVKFPDLTDDAIVLGVNPETMVAQWEKPTRFVREKYVGDMISYKSQTADLMVTPDHRMVYADVNDVKNGQASHFRVRAADQLPKDFYLPQTVVWPKSHEYTLMFGGRRWTAMAFAEFMGWYLSEGCSSAKHRSVRIIQNTNGRHVEELDRVMKAIPFHVGKYKHGGKTSVWQIRDKQLSADLAVFGTSLKKHAPTLLKELSPECLQAFLIAYARGDGHFAVKNPTKITIGTGSRQMADDLHECAVKAGWASSLSLRLDPGGNEFNGYIRPASKVYKLYIRASKAEGSDRKFGSQIKARHTTRVPYDGLVYCVSVPSTAVVVRRNGRVSVSGNCLPMRYEWRRHSYSSLGWHDPRGLDEDGEPLIEVSEDGERIPINIDAEIELDKREGTLLWPERFGEREVSILERQLGPWASAGQLQQRPEPKGGGIIKSDWWQPWDATNYPNMDMIIACVDTAYTKKTENDPSAMTVWGIFSQDVSVQAPNHAGGRHGGLISYERPYTETNPRVMLMYAWQGRYELHDLVNKVSETCKKMKVDTLLIENKAAGHSVAQEIKRMYGFERFSVQMFDPKSQDKLARLYSIQHLFAEGLVYAPNKAWAEMVIQQVGQFPKGKHDDLCLVGNTRILMADGTEKLLQEVVVGDIVRTPKGTQRVSASSLTGIKPIWRLDYSGGSIEGTAFHPVFANGEWREIASLSLHDVLAALDVGLGACVVEAVKFTHIMQPVYNLTVEGEGCYYANGILVHNCDTVSMAMRHLRDTGVILRPTEWQAELEDSLQFKGVNKNAPLYPA
jgi:predicted phage terminase large subunit-like protein